jgi:hypothetical protein
MASALLQVTISNLSGDTLKTVEFKGDPLQLCSAVCKDERPGSAKAKVSSLRQLQHPDLHKRLAELQLLVPATIVCSTLNSRGMLHSCMLHSCS